MHASRVVAALGTLALLAAASWLPARAAEHGVPPGYTPDLARPELTAPQDLPAAPVSPVSTVSTFFWHLAHGVAALGAPPPQEGPLPSSGLPAAFSRAYTLLAPNWQAEQPFAAFLRHWGQLARLEPLAVLAAAPPAGQPSVARVFVEVRTLSRPREGCKTACLGFGYGFFTVVSVPGSGWRLSGGGLQAEDLGARGPDPRRIALNAARSLASRTPGGQAASQAQGSVNLTMGPEHQATVRVVLGPQTYRVALYQLVDGGWVALRVGT